MKKQLLSLAQALRSTLVRLGWSAPQTPTQLDFAFELETVRGEGR